MSENQFTQLVHEIRRVTDEIQALRRQLQPLSALPAQIIAVQQELSRLNEWEVDRERAIRDEASQKLKELNQLLSNVQKAAEGLKEYIKVDFRKFEDQVKTSKEKQVMEVRKHITSLLLELTKLKGLIEETVFSSGDQSEPQQAVFVRRREEINRLVSRTQKNIDEFIEKRKAIERTINSLLFDSPSDKEVVVAEVPVLRIVVQDAKEGSKRTIVQFPGVFKEEQSQGEYPSEHMVSSSGWSPTLKSLVEMDAKFFAEARSEPIDLKQNLEKLHAAFERLSSTGSFGSVFRKELVILTGADRIER